MAPPCWSAATTRIETGSHTPKRGLTRTPTSSASRLQQPLADGGEVRLAQRRRGVRVGVRVFPPVGHAQHDPATALLRAGLEVRGAPDRQAEQHCRGRLRAVDGLVGQAASGVLRVLGEERVGLRATRREHARLGRRVVAGLGGDEVGGHRQPRGDPLGVPDGDDPIAHALTDGGQVVERLGQRRVRAAALRQGGVDVRLGDRDAVGRGRPGQQVVQHGTGDDIARDVGRADSAGGELRDSVGLAQRDVQPRLHLLERYRRGTDDDRGSDLARPGTAPADHHADGRHHRKRPAHLPVHAAQPLTAA